MKRVALCLMMIFLLTEVMAYESQEVVVGEELLEVTPLVEETYEEETIVSSVFKIKRLNKTNATLQLQYTQGWIGNNVEVWNIVEKEINSYSSAHTGEVQINRSGNFTLVFVVNGRELVWNYSISFFEEVETTVNETIINESIVEVNETSNETEVEIDADECLANHSLVLNKERFLVGEKLEMNFLGTQDDVAIIYWIENSNGDEVKKRLSSTNTNTKSYTFSKTNFFREPHFVYANITSCYSSHHELIVVVEDPNFIFEDEKKEKEVEEKYDEDSKVSVLSMKEISVFGEAFYEIKLYLYRGNTQKSVVIVSVDQEDKQLWQKVKLPKKYADSEITFRFPIYSPEGKLLVEGLGEVDEKKLYSKHFAEEEKTSIDIVNVYTRQTYLDEVVKLYVRVSGVGEVMLTATAADEEYIVEEEIDGEQTLILEFYNISATEKVFLSLTQQDLLVKDEYSFQLVEQKTTQQKTSDEIERKEVNVSLYESSNELTASAVQPIVAQESPVSPIIVIGLLVAVLGFFMITYKQKIINTFIKRTKL